MCYLSGSYLVYLPIPCKNSSFLKKKFYLITFFPLYIKPVKLLSKHYPQNFDPCWILFICLSVSASVMSLRTQILVILKPELNEVKKDFVHFVLQGHIFKVMTSLHSRHQSFWGFFLNLCSRF